jgi:uncharacterized protein (TIGR02391 family)
MATSIPLFTAEQLQSICQVLADTEEGLTGSEIGYILGNCRVPDVSSDMTKWKRLFNALITIQNEKQIGNYTLMFINRAMDPVRYTNRPDFFSSRRDALNNVLAFTGFKVGDDGKVRWAQKAQNLDEALARRNRLHSALMARQVHPDVLLFCKEELLKENCFHAVFEAMKSVSHKLQTLSGVDADGAALVDSALGCPDGSAPKLAINDLQTETQKGEQRGFSNLLKGLFGTIRNPLAHNPKVEWPMSEQDALDIFSTISLVHRKLDQAKKGV